MRSYDKDYGEMCCLYFGGNMQECSSRAKQAVQKTRGDLRLARRLQRRVTSTQLVKGDEVMIGRNNVKRTSTHSVSMRQRE